MLEPILALAIAVLFTLAGAAAVLAIVDSVMKARRAYDALTDEAALLRSGFASQIEARELHMRRASVRAKPRRPMPRRQPLPACAAA